jgi:hypothetical protein
MMRKIGPNLNFRENTSNLAGNSKGTLKGNLKEFSFTENHLDFPNGELLNNSRSSIILNTAWLAVASFILSGWELEYPGLVSTYDSAVGGGRKL